MDVQVLHGKLQVDFHVGKILLEIKYLLAVYVVNIGFMNVADRGRLIWDIVIDIDDGQGEGSDIETDEINVDAQETVEGIVVHKGVNDGKEGPKAKVKIEAEGLSNDRLNVRVAVYPYMLLVQLYPWIWSSLGI